MKRPGQMTGMLLMLLIAGNTSLNAQRGMREVIDSTRMNRHGRDLDFRQMRSPDQKNDSMLMNRMHRNFIAGQRHGNMRGMVPGRGYMRSMSPSRSDMWGIVPGRGYMRGISPWRDDMRGMLPGRQYGINPHERFGMRGPGQVPGDRIRHFRPQKGWIESIPNLTDKQKKEIAELRQQQQNEMKKLREENSGKMKALRDEHRKKIMGLLTDEQKKSLEQTSGQTDPDKPKVK